MKVSDTLALLIGALLVSGCGSQKGWTHATKGESDFYQDRHQCQQEAAQTYPPVFTQRTTSPGVQVQDSRPVQTNCVTVGGQVQCTSARTGVDTTIYNRPPSTATEDANATNRSTATQSCLFAKGYRLR